MEKNTNKNKILIIEDDAAIIDVYEVAMKQAGINMEVISWGKKAIEEVKKMQEGKREKPSLVLLDLILPDISGLEILKEIKSNDKTKDIIVYILSNYSSDDLSQAEGFKPDKFILKTGITPTELIKLIKEVTGK